MRASTVGCRVLDRCGSLGVESSLKDIYILAAVLNSRCRSKFGPYLRASLRLAVMGLFRDGRDRRDLSGSHLVVVLLAYSSMSNHESGGLCFVVKVM